MFHNSNQAKHFQIFIGPFVTTYGAIKSWLPLPYNEDNRYASKDFFAYLMMKSE